MVIIRNSKLALKFFIENESFQFEITKISLEKLA